MPSIGMNTDKDVRKMVMRPVSISIFVRIDTLLSMYLEKGDAVGSLGKCPFNP